MKEEALDALTNSVIEELSRKNIAERDARQSIMEGRISLDELWDLMPKEPKPFDIAEVKDEISLREIIMDRVLETAAHNITASVSGRPSVPIEELPEEERAKCLNKFMLEMLDSNRGPGALLRLSIATTILNYRMRNRLKKLLSTLNPSSSKFKRAEAGIAYIERQIKAGMFYFEVWTLLSC